MVRDRYTTLTERGQTSIPALIRKLCNLKAGQRLLWHRVSEREIRIIVEAEPACAGPAATLGYARRFNPLDRRGSDEVLKELREGED